MLKEETRTSGLRGKGSREVRAGSEVRRRSSSGSTASETSSKKTAAPSLTVRTKGKVAEKGGEKGKPNLSLARASNVTEVSDAVSIASCQGEGLKWAGGSAESLVTGLTRKLQGLEAELSRSKAKLSETEADLFRTRSDLVESRAHEAEVRLLMAEQTEQLAGLKERVNGAEGLLEENPKREGELVEMAGFVRGLQERVKHLEHENTALRREGSESAKVEKGEGTEGLVGEVADVSAWAENGVKIRSGFETSGRPGSESELKIGIDTNEGGFGTRFSGDVVADVKEEGTPPGRSSAKSEGVAEAERLRQVVKWLTEQLGEMKAFLADYGLTWVGSAGPGNAFSPPGQLSPGSEALNKRPGSATGEGQWEPSKSWAPAMGRGNERAWVTDETAPSILPTKNPSVSVPSWLAAHLEEQNGRENAPSPDARLQNVSSPELSSPSALTKQSTGNASVYAKPGTVKPATLEVPSQSQRTPNPPERSSSEHVLNSINSREKRDEKIDVRALREAIDGLNALAYEGGATVVTSPGGREHRLQVRG